MRLVVFSDLGYSLLLWTELEHVRINQSLKDIFEDVTTLERVPQHPIIQAIVGIVGLTDLLRTSALRKL